MKNRWDYIYKHFKNKSASWETENISTGKPKVLEYLENFTPPKKIIDLGCGRGI